MITQEQQFELIKNAKVTKKIFTEIKKSDYSEGDKIDLTYLFEDIKEGQFEIAFRNYNYMDTFVRDLAIEILLKNQKKAGK